MGKCFEKDGYMYCESITRDGKEIVSQSGKWFKFPASKQKETQEASQSE